MKDSDIDEMMGIIDKNGDGKISYTEFRVMMGAIPLLHVWNKEFILFYNLNCSVCIKQGPAGRQIMILGRLRTKTLSDKSSLDSTRLLWEDTEALFSINRWNNWS